MRQGVHQSTRVWLARRGLSDWPWDRGARAEQRITTAIWELLDPVADPVLARIVRDALLAGVSPAAAQAVGTELLWGCEPAASPGPDLCLLDAQNRIRVVIEHKCGAPANCRPYRRFNSLPRFGDPLALSLPPRPADPGQATDGPWGQGQLWQIDYYRCVRAWIRPLRNGGPVTLADATGVLWVLLDLHGRPAAEVFWGAHTADAWATTGYQQFVPPLIAAYDSALRGGQQDRAVRLEPLLRMIGS